MFKMTVAGECIVIRLTALVQKGVFGGYCCLGKDEEEGKEKYFLSKIWMDRTNSYFCTPKTGNGSVVQLVRMPPCHGGGRGFESRPVRKASANAEAFAF